MEIIIQDFFEEYLKKNAVTFQRGFRLDRSVIDFVAELNGKTYGIEVKSSYSNVYTAIGELANFSRYFSHLILVTTEEFLNKFNEVTEKTGILTQIGIIAFQNGEFNEIRKPTAKEYFFKDPGKVAKTKKDHHKDGITAERFTQEEERFFKRFKGTPFMVSDVVKGADKKFANAYRFIMMLRKMGLVEEMNRGAHPKMFMATNKLYRIIDMPKRI